MPVYMTQFAYTPEAWAALLRSPEDRSRVLGEHLDRLGGQLAGAGLVPGEREARGRGDGDVTQRRCPGRPRPPCVPWRRPLPSAGGGPRSSSG